MFSVVHPYICLSHLLLLFWMCSLAASVLAVKFSATSRGVYVDQRALKHSSHLTSQRGAVPVTGFIVCVWTWLCFHCFPCLLNMNVYTQRVKSCFKFHGNVTWRLPFLLWLFCSAFSSFNCDPWWKITTWSLVCWYSVCSTCACAWMSTFLCMSTCMCESSLCLNPEMRLRTKPKPHDKEEMDSQMG